MDEAPSVGRQAKWTSRNYLPYLRQAAESKGLPAGMAGGPEVMAIINRYGGTPESLAKYLHTSDPHAQAALILRMTGRT